MPLPFEDKESVGKRKWQCFACGHEHTNYEDFREHIVSNHEEGRDYILCPKCSAPVRDVKAHYKAKHPGWNVPAGTQHKATVWNDFTGGKKKRSTSAKFRKGSFVSQKMNGKELHYRSGYECEVYELLEQLPEVIHYDAEPLEIPYCHKGTMRKYRPDLSILFADGRKEIWEIKPASQTSLPVNDAKWTAANQFCLEKGWNFMVLTEVGMGKLRRQVKGKLRSTPNPEIPESTENWEVMSEDQFQEWLESQDQ